MDDRGEDGKKPKVRITSDQQIVNKCEDPNRPGVTRSGKIFQANPKKISFPLDLSLIETLNKIDKELSNMSEEESVVRSMADGTIGGEGSFDNLVEGGELVERLASDVEHGEFTSNLIDTDRSSSVGEVRSQSADTTNRFVGSMDWVPDIPWVNT